MQLAWYGRVNLFQKVVVLIQAATFLPLAFTFFYTGNWRLGLAQVFLGAVTSLVYL